MNTCNSGLKPSIKYSLYVKYFLTYIGYNTFASDLSTSDHNLTMDLTKACISISNVLYLISSKVKILALT